jgi:hypothetical protein
MAIASTGGSATPASSKTSAATASKHAESSSRAISGSIAGASWLWGPKRGSGVICTYVHYTAQASECKRPKTATYPLQRNPVRWLVEAESDGKRLAGGFTAPGLLTLGRNGGLRLGAVGNPGDTCRTEPAGEPCGPPFGAIRRKWMVSEMGPFLGVVREQ